MSDVHNILDICDESKDSLIIEGVHGIGKSEQVTSWAKKNNYHIETLILSVLEEGDLIGMPMEENGVTTWAPPAFLKRMKDAEEEGKKCVLFLDELNRASISIRQAALELVLNKRINDHHLPKDSIVVSAINPTDGYQTDEMDPALLDRFMYMEMKPDASEWLEWAQKNSVHKIVRMFIAKNPKYIHTTSDNEKITPTPRSWTKLSDNIKVFEKKKFTEDILYTIVKGKVGSTVGTEFVNFYNEHSNMIGIEDIKEAAEKAKNLENAIEAVRDVIDGQESITLISLGESIIDDFNKNEYKTLDEAIGMVAYLHAIPLETTTSILKSLQSNDFKTYTKISKVDMSIFHKILKVAEGKKND